MSYEIKTIEGRDIMVAKMLSFWDYIDKKSSRSEFNGLSLSAKEEIFLKWKFGFESPEANAALQSTENEIVMMLDNLPLADWDKMSEFNREYFSMKKQFSNQSRAVWSEIEKSEREFSVKKQEFKNAGF
jgi:hypothetical protein